MRSLPILVSALVAACSTAPDESLHTVLVGFESGVTEADVSALRDVGGSVQYRFPLARSVSLRTDVPATAYVAVPNVLRALDLGAAENPMVSVFIHLAGPVSAAAAADDVAFVEARGARSVYLAEETGVIAAIMPLARVRELELRGTFVSVTVSLESDTIQ